MGPPSQGTTHRPVRRPHQQRRHRRTYGPEHLLTWTVSHRLACRSTHRAIPRNSPSCRISNPRSRSVVQLASLSTTARRSTGSGQIGLSSSKWTRKQHPPTRTKVRQKHSTGSTPLWSKLATTTFWQAETRRPPHLANGHCPPAKQHPNAETQCTCPLRSDNSSTLTCSLYQVPVQRRSVYVRAQGTCGGGQGHNGSILTARETPIDLLGDAGL